MFIPIVPFVPNTKVINKTIVYNDTILPLKNVGSKIKITIISNIDEFSLEICLKKIFESNPNVVFNTIQYSKDTKKIYFYADKELSKKAWDDIRVSKYKSLASNDKIVEEIEQILNSDKIKEKECISLCDVAYLIKEKNTDYNKIKMNYKNICETKLNTKLNSLKYVMYDIDYYDNELHILFSRIGGDKNDITFSKNNGDLYISNSNKLWRWNQEIFNCLAPELSKLYDELKSFSAFNEEKRCNIKAVNSNFLVNISSSGVDIFVKSKDNPSKKYFELSSNNYSDEYRCDCNSSNVISTIKNREDAIFRKIFVKISDCPYWSQERLYLIWEIISANEKKLENEQQDAEMKSTKKLELKRKIFPFLKKYN